MKGIFKFNDVITTDEKEEIADKLREEFYRIEQDAVDVETEVQEDDDWGITPVDEMSMAISAELANMTAERFDEMIDGMSFDVIKEIIARLRSSYYKTAVRMIQAMFLVNGYEDAVKALDLLTIFEKYNEDIYECFIVDLFDTDLFEWFLTDMCIHDNCEQSCASAGLS